MVRIPPRRGPRSCATGVGFHPSRGDLVNHRRAMLCGAAAGLWIGAGAAQAQSDLNAKVEAAAANHKFAGARIGVSILDLDTGRALADIHATDALTPASNMKLLTTGAALLVLGKDFVFKTELIMDGSRLVIRGS